VYDAEPFELVLDVLVEGEGLRRNADVRLAEGRLTVNDLELDLGGLFWVARRAGMVLLFASEYTAAIKGGASALEELARGIEASIDQNARRRELLRPVAREVVVVTAGTAVSGEMNGEPLNGLFVTVITQAGIHLFTRRRHAAFPWPADASAGDGADGRGDVLVVASASGSRLTMRYLFPEEIRAVIKVAEKARAEPPTDRPLEMFSRREVAPPTPAELPEFSASVGSLQDASERAASEIGEDLRNRAGLGPHFFETHFMELGEIALGPLLLRKSAASEANGLSRAVAAMDASGLLDDTKAAIGQATDRLAAVYEQELRRVGTERKLAIREVQARELTPDQRLELATKLLAPFDRIAPMFGKLKEQQEALLARLEVLEDGPPDAAEGDVEGAADEWRGTLRRLDRAFETAWREMSGEIERSWEDRFLPQLSELAAMQGRGREWMQLLLIGIVTTLIAGALVFVLLL
jgi:hypothetical protein